MFGKNRNKKKGNNDEVATRSAKATWTVYCIVAVLMLLLGGHCYYKAEMINPNNEFFLQLYSIAAPVLTTFGSIILTSAVGTFVLKRTGLLEIVKKQIAEIMVDSGFIKLLSEEELLKFRKNINEIIHSPEVSNNEESLLNTVDRAIAPILQSYYFKRYDLDIDCKIYDDYIEKKLTRTIIVRRVGKQDAKISLSDFFGVGFDKIVNENIPQANLEVFKINGKSIIDKISLEEVEKPRIENCVKEYELKVVDDKYCDEIEEMLTIKEKDVRVKVVTVTKTYADDILVIHKLPTACKEYKVRFNYNQEEYTVIGAPFGFMDNHIDGKFEMSDISGKAVEIEFYDWILPGDGVAFAINVKK